MSAKPTKVMSPKARLAFPAFFTPTAMEEGQEKKYQCVLLFDKDADLSALKAAAKAAMEEKWPDAAKRPKNLRSPFRDGDEKEEWEGFPGQIYISARSNSKPGVVDANVQPIIEPSEIYGGCYVRATLNAFAYDTAGNKGVAFGLGNVQKLADGPAFDGRTRAEDDFTPVAGEETPEANDESPFDETPAPVKKAAAPKAKPEAKAEAPAKASKKAASQDDSWMD